MYEGEINSRGLEQIVLWIFSAFSLIMIVAALAVGWELWIIGLILIGMFCCWWCVVKQYQTFRFRAAVISCVSLLNFIIYGVEAESFFGILTPMAAIIILLSLYGIPEIMHLSTVTFIGLLLYHLFVKRSIAMPTETVELYRMIIQIVSLLTVEGLIQYFVKRQIKMRQQLADTIANLKKTEKSKDDFLANVSHEIRTPISSICGISDMLRMEELPGEIHEDMENIYMAGCHLLAVVSDILDFTELQMGKLAITEVPYDLSSTLNDVMNMSLAKNDKGLEIRLECDDNIPSSMLGDEQKIKRVLLNLIGNAIKFTEKGSVRIRVQARKESYGVNLCVSIRDTGIGMEPEQVENLFQMFNQADTNSNRKTEGIGLGLAISQRIVHQMRGFITVKSEFGKGSEFQFVIPQKVLDATPIHPMVFEQHRTFKNSFQAPEAKILVVDDNLMNLKVIKGLLAPYQIQVYIAESGEVALQKIDQMQFDFVFMDQMMPKMDGIETLHRIRRKPGAYFQTVPVIALTANAVAGAREMFLSEGFHDYITKPIDMSDMDRVLQKYIPQHKKKAVELSGKEEKPVAVQKQKEPFGTILDTKTGMAYCGGNWEDYLDIIGSYIDNGRQTADKLEKFYEGEDWENYTILVHALKSNSKGIGAPALSKMAESLEMAGKENDEEKIRREHALMISSYRELLDMLDRERKRHETVTGEKETQEAELKEITREDLEQLLERLSEKLENFESEAIREVLTEISGYRFADEDLKERFKEMEQKIKAYDFMGAEELVDELKKGLK